MSQLAARFFVFNALIATSFHSINRRIYTSSTRKFAALFMVFGIEGCCLK